MPGRHWTKGQYVGPSGMRNGGISESPDPLGAFRDRLVNGVPKHLTVDRFAQVAGGASQETAPTHPGLVMPGHDDDGQPLVQFFDDLLHFKPTQARHV